MNREVWENLKKLNYTKMVRLVYLGIILKRNGYRSAQLSYSISANKGTMHLPQFFGTPCRYIKVISVVGFLGAFLPRG